MGEFLKLRWIRINFIFVRMNTKLTLSVDQDLIQQAKEYAKSNGTSISKMVENYLQSVLTSKKEVDQSKVNILDSITGIMKYPDPNWDDDRAKWEYFKDKYDL